MLGPSTREDVLRIPSLHAPALPGRPRHRPGTHLHARACRACPSGAGLLARATPCDRADRPCKRRPSPSYRRNNPRRRRPNPSARDPRPSAPPPRGFDPAPREPRDLPSQPRAPHAIPPVLTRPCAPAHVVSPFTNMVPSFTNTGAPFTNMGAPFSHTGAPSAHLAPQEEKIVTRRPIPRNDAHARPIGGFEPQPKSPGLLETSRHEHSER